MKRWVIVAATALAAIAGVAIAAAVSRSGGSGSRVVASVGDQRITRDQLDLTVGHFHEQAEAEGRPFPRAGTRAYRDVERRALALLLDRAKLAVAAGRIGIHVSNDEVEHHLPTAQGGPDADEGPAVRTKAEAAFVRGTVRAQLLTEKVFRRVTREVAVSPAAVRAYYSAHRAIYGRARFSELAISLRRQLVSARRNAAMNRWLAAARRMPAEIRDAALKG
jgi:hypothetical protein